MGLFNTSALEGYAVGLFNQFSPVALTPAGTKPVQATLPATKTGTPAQDPLAGSGSNGVISTGSKTSGGLFGTNISPALMIVGTLVAVAAIVMIARR